ncbi:MAG: DDE-type integrase/transposase/recombinase [Roseibium sp.]
MSQRQGRPADYKYWLWRAVDQHGVVLDKIFRKKRDKRVANQLLRSLMKRLGFVPRRIVTDKVRSCGTALREIAPDLIHWPHKGLNNRAENSHLLFRKRERMMQAF